LREGVSATPKDKAKEGEPNPEVEETGKGAKDGVMGEAAVAEKEGIRPPQESQDPPAPNRPTPPKIQIRREKNASQNVA
jgi:hypothetical protein